MPNMTPAFNQLKNIMQVFDAAKSEEILKKIHELATSRTRAEFQAAMKHVFEQIVNKAKQFGNEKRFQIVVQFMHEISKISADTKLELDKIGQINNKDQQKKALFDYLTSQKFIQFYSSLLIDNLNIYDQLKRPEYKEETMKSIFDKQLKVSNKITNTVLSQALLSTESRLLTTALNVFLMMLDLYCIEIGIPPCFTMELEGDDSTYHQMNRMQKLENF